MKIALALLLLAACASLPPRPVDRPSIREVVHPLQPKMNPLRHPASEWRVAWTKTAKIHNPLPYPVHVDYDCGFWWPRGAGTEDVRGEYFQPGETKIVLIAAARAEAYQPTCYIYGWQRSR